MGKYLPTPSSPPTFPPGGNNCGPLSAGAGALAWDVVDQTCYPVEGLAITIGPEMASLHGAMEVWNTNVSMNGTQAPMVNSLGLPGAVVV
jgi:hypothetical protein